MSVRKSQVGNSFAPELETRWDIRGQGFMVIERFINEPYLTILRGKLDEKQKGVSYRAAKLYKFDKRKYAKNFQKELSFGK